MMSKRKLFWIGLVASVLFVAFDARLYQLCNFDGEVVWVLMHAGIAAIVAIVAWACYTP